MEPRTEAGRRLRHRYELLAAAGRRSTLTVDIGDVLAIEDETRAATLDALSEAVKGLPTHDYPGAFNRSANQFRTAVLTLIDNLRESDRG